MRKIVEYLLFTHAWPLLVVVPHLLLLLVEVVLVVGIGAHNLCFLSDSELSLPVRVPALFAQLALTS